MNFTGCRKTEENKSVVFAGVEQIVNEEQINIHFAWRDKPLEDETCYSIDIYESAEGQSKYSVAREQLVQNGKLGFSVMVNGNTFKFQDLYFEGNKAIFSPQPESLRYDICKCQYKNDQKVENKNVHFPRSTPQLVIL